MAAALTNIVRTAPDGARVAITLPARVGKPAWSGHTRFMGPDLFLAFDLAKAGQHKAIPQLVMPGARSETFRRRGFDLVLYEAADRSDSCLVWAGPHTDATTWLAGPAPRREVLNRIASMVRFTDSPTGASLTPTAGSNLRQFGTLVIGSGDDLVVFAYGTEEARNLLPKGRGAQRGAEEVWKRRLDLEGEEKAAVSGTAYEWRYTLGNDTCVFDVILPYDSRRAEPLSERRAADVLSGVRVTWAA